MGCSVGAAPSHGISLRAGCSTSVAPPGHSCRKCDGMAAGKRSESSLFLAAAAFARDRFGLTVVTGTLEKAQFQAGMFDVITFWHVLEHVEDSTQTLAEAYRILRPGGWLVVQLPDPLCWQAGWFGKYWAGFDAPRHLYGFPPATLRRQLVELGWSEDRTHVLQGGNSAFWLSLRMKLGDTHPGSCLLRLVKTPFSPNLRRLCSLSFVGSGKGRQSRILRGSLLQP